MLSGGDGGYSRSSARSKGRGIGYSYQKVADVRRNAMKGYISDAFPMESEGFPRLGTE
jgi:hypothetical protein